MNLLIKISKIIDKIVKIVGTIAAYLSIAMMILMLFEVFSRRIFHSPTIWSYEMVTFLFGAMIMLILPYGLQLGVNVRVDVVYNKYGEKLKKIMDIVLFVVFFGTFMILFTQAAIPYFTKSLQSLERSWSSWSPILWPVKSTIPACGILMLLQGISELIKMFLALMGRDDLLELHLSDEESLVEEARTQAEEVEELTEHPCPYCSRKIPGTSKFCPYCGETLEGGFSLNKEGGNDA